MIYTKPRPPPLPPGFAPADRDVATSQGAKAYPPLSLSEETPDILTRTKKGG